MLFEKFLILFWYFLRIFWYFYVKVDDNPTRRSKNRLFKISSDHFATKRKVVPHARNSPKNMFGGVPDQYGAPPIGRKPLKIGQKSLNGQNRVRNKFFRNSRCFFWIFQIFFGVYSLFTCKTDRLSLIKTDEAQKMPLFNVNRLVAGWFLKTALLNIFSKFFLQICFTLYLTTPKKTFLAKNYWKKKFFLAVLETWRTSLPISQKSSKIG